MKCETDKCTNDTIGGGICSSCQKEWNMVRAVKYQDEINNSIPRSSLPALPDEAIPPFVVKRSTPTNQWFVCGREDEIVAETSYEKYATFLAALLNACYSCER